MKFEKTTKKKTTKLLHQKNFIGNYWKKTNYTQLCVNSFLLVKLGTTAVKEMKEIAVFYFLHILRNTHIEHKPILDV